LNRVIAVTPDGPSGLVGAVDQNLTVEMDVLKRLAGAVCGPGERPSFTDDSGTALVHWTGRHSEKVSSISYPDQGLTTFEARRTALAACRGDRKARSASVLRGVVCGVGR
jgi:hypothetical protein